MRRPLDIYKFRQSGEVPPLDEEAYVVWKFENALISEKDANLLIADYRRAKAKSNRRTPTATDE